MWTDLDQLASLVLRRMAEQGASTAARLAWVRELVAAAEAATTDAQLSELRNHVSRLLCSLEKGN